MASKGHRGLPDRQNGSSKIFLKPGDKRTKRNFGVPTAFRRLLVLLVENILVDLAKIRYIAQSKAMLAVGDASSMAFADNPIINSPFEKPQWHFELDDEGQPTGKKLSGRRDSVQVVPVPAAKRRGPRQRELALEEKTTSNTLVNAIRKDVDQWRDLPPGQWGVTPETQRLLLHWRDPNRERKQFFCQREAIETLIWLTEVAPKCLSENNLNPMNRL